MWKIIAVTGAAAACITAAETPLRLEEVTREALARNPEVLAAQKRYEAARQRPAQASSLPDPMLSVGYNSVGSPLPGKGNRRRSGCERGRECDSTAAVAGQAEASRRHRGTRRRR